MNILCVLHDNTGPAGLLGEGVARRGGLLHELTPHEGDALPSSTAGYDGAIVMGGAMDSWDDAGYPHFPALLQLMRDFHAEAKPVMGVCLGAQLLARSFGGRAYRHREMEIGFTDLVLTPEAGNDQLLHGLGPAVRLMEWHQDTFDLPPGAALLVRGLGCTNQAFRVGDSTYAFQFHLETTKPMVRSWFRARNEEHQAAYPGLWDRLQLELEADLPGQVDFTRQVADRWMDLVEARAARPARRSRAG